MDNFERSNDINIQHFIEKSKNQNTTKSTSLWIRTYLNWAEARGAPKQIETLPPIDLY